VARRLGISVKTADRHIQNAYRKIGVSSRAAATLFAMEHGLVPQPGPFRSSGDGHSALS
jgi:DNA-binding NarL/FixJ family response regulator